MIPSSIGSTLPWYGNCLRWMSECPNERLSHPPLIFEAVLSRDLLSGEASAFHHRVSLR
jgi:hypothetical protein